MEVLLVELGRSGIVAIVLGIMFFLHYWMLRKLLPLLMKENKEQITTQSIRHQQALERMMVTHRETILADREEFRQVLQQIGRNNKEALEMIEGRRQDSFRSLEGILSSTLRSLETQARDSLLALGKQIDIQHAHMISLLVELSRRIKRLDIRVALFLKGQNGE